MKTDILIRLTETQNKLMEFMNKTDINDYIYVSLFLTGWFTIAILFMKAF